jgi:hypothetical protein
MSLYTVHEKELILNELLHSTWKGNNATLSELHSSDTEWVITLYEKELILHYLLKRLLYLESICMQLSMNMITFELTSLLRFVCLLQYILLCAALEPPNWTQLSKMLFLKPMKQRAKYLSNTAPRSPVVHVIMFTYVVAIKWFQLSGRFLDEYIKGWISD